MIPWFFWGSCWGTGWTGSTRVSRGHATIYSVKFHWKAPTYHGGEDILGYEARPMGFEWQETHESHIDLMAIIEEIEYCWYIS